MVQSTACFVILQNSAVLTEKCKSAQQVLIFPKAVAKSMMSELYRFESSSISVADVD